MATQGVKLTNEELEQIEVVKKNKETILVELGQIKLAELNLEKRLEKAEEFLSQLEKQETEIAKYLEDKYGNGTVNVETGEFTSN